MRNGLGFFEHPVQPSLSLRRHTHGLLAERQMHMTQTFLKLQEFRSRHQPGCTGFLGDACVAFFNILPGNKNAVAPNSLMEEESLWQILIEIHSRVLHTGLLLLGHFHTPKHDVAENET